MKKYVRMTALFLVLMLVLCGAAYAETKDTSGLLATVDGVDVPIDDALAEYEYYAAMYAMYGMESQLGGLAQEIAEYYVKLELICRQYDLLGLETDMEALKASAQEEYQNAIRSYTTYVSKKDKTEEQISQEAEALLIEDGYGIEYFEDYIYDSIRLEAVLAHYTGDIAVSEEDVRAYYDELVAADKASYEASFALYEQAGQYGERIMYVPEGVRSVKHILILLSEEDQDTLRNLEAEMASIELKLAAANADIAQLTADQAAIQAQIDAIFASIEPEAQDILNKLAAGEDFIALMEQYGEDPGMKAEPNKTNGYQVHAESAQWVTPFRDAAMALQKPGDVSQPVRTSYGLHIIRYENDIPAGPVAFEEISAELEAELLDTKISDTYNALVEQWYEEAEVTFYLENFTDQAEEE